MLDRRYFDVALVQGGAHGGVADVLRMGLDVDRVIQIRAAEHNAGVRRRRTQGHQYLLSRVKADSRRTNGIFERSLIQHLNGDRTMLIAAKVPYRGPRPKDRTKQAPGFQIAAGAKAWNVSNCKSRVNPPAGEEMP